MDMMGYVVFGAAFVFSTYITFFVLPKFTRWYTRRQVLACIERDEKLRKEIKDRYFWR